MTDKSNFRHDSIQDRKTIGKLLRSITEGVEKGELEFSDEDGEIHLSPDGLLHLKLTASKEDGRNRVNLRVTWQDEANKTDKKKSLKVNNGKGKK